MRILRSFSIYWGNHDDRFSQKQDHAARGRTATAFRGEVGLRSDKIFAVDSGGQLSLFGKFAYAHDEISNPQANVAFAAIGGIGGSAPFTVFGTRPSRDLALTTDFRDVFAEVVVRHLGIDDPAPIFPGYVIKPTNFPGLFGK